MHLYVLSLSYVLILSFSLSSKLWPCNRLTPFVLPDPHRSALLASQVLPYISQGDAYKQLEWVLLESHSNLLDILLKDPAKNAALIEQRCQRLSALIMNSTLPMSEDLLNLQEQVRIYGPKSISFSGENCIVSNDSTVLVFKFYSHIKKEINFIFRSKNIKLRHSFQINI